MKRIHMSTGHAPLFTSSWITFPSRVFLIGGFFSSSTTTMLPAWTTCSIDMKAVAVACSFVNGLQCDVHDSLISFFYRDTPTHTGRHTPPSTPYAVSTTAFYLVVMMMTDNRVSTISRKVEHNSQPSFHHNFDHRLSQRLFAQSISRFQCVSEWYRPENKQLQNAPVRRLRGLCKHSYDDHARMWEQQTTSSGNSESPLALKLHR